MGFSTICTKSEQSALRRRWLETGRQELTGTGVEWVHLEFADNHWNLPAWPIDKAGFAVAMHACEGGFETMPFVATYDLAILSWT